MRSQRPVRDGTRPERTALHPSRLAPERVIEICPIDLSEASDAQARLALANRAIRPVVLDPVHHLAVREGEKRFLAERRENVVLVEECVFARRCPRRRRRNRHRSLHVS